MTEAAERLAGWIHDVDLQPGATRVDVVSGAATALATTTDGAAILDLVLLAHGVSQGEAPASVSAALREQDEASVVHAGDVVASLTAAAGVAFALEGEDSRSVLAGLAVRSASFLGLEPAVPELDGLARAGLARVSERQRQRSKLVVNGPNFKTLLGDWTELGEDEAVGVEDFNLARQAVEKASKAIAGITPVALSAITARFDVIEEEVDTLWWVFGEYSELTDAPFTAVPEAAVGCVAGLELASRTAQEAPLPSARAVLSRVLQTNAGNATNLYDAIPATIDALKSDTWNLPQPQAHRLSPVLTSLEELRSLNAKKSVWKQSTQARWEVDLTRSITVLDLAEQVLREVLLTRLLAE